MKKLLAIATLTLCFAVAVNAQNQPTKPVGEYSSPVSSVSPWSINAGYLSSEIKFSGNDVSFSLDCNGYYAGLGLDLSPNSPFQLSIGFNWDYKTIKMEDLLDYDIKLNMHYARIPVLIKYVVPMGSNVDFFIGGGASANVGLFGEYDYDKSMIPEDLAQELDNDDIFDENGGLKRVFAQVSVSAGFEFGKRFIIRAGYDHGLTKAMSIDFTNKINAFNVGLGLRF